MQFMKKAIAKKEEDTSLLKLLDMRLAGWEDQRSHKVIHMSDLSKDHGFCPREFALLDASKKKPKGQYISTALRVTFDNGDALSNLCRNKWLEWDVVGSWACSYCKHSVSFSKKPKGDCPSCKAKGMWRYVEENFIDPKTKASGSIDFFIDFGTGKHVAVECKTISKDMFKELKAPMAEHRIRTKLYLELMRRSDHPSKKLINMDQAFVLYISKGFGAKNEDFGSKVVPFREYMVESEKPLADPYFEKAMAVENFRNGGKMPAGICPSSMVPRVKYCSCPKECFSGSYPAGV